MRGSTSQLLTRLSRDTLVFSAASLLTVVLAFWTVRAVTTHLTPSEYGQLAIYYFFASLLTILYNLVLLPGTLLRVFGASGEEDVDDDQRLRAPISGKRVALTTGLLATIGVILTGTLVVYVAAEPLVSLLFDTGGSRRILAIAATSAGLGAIWRLVSNVSRFETKPWKYACITNARPVLVLAFVSYTLSHGEGVARVIAANATGTGVAVLLALLFTWRNYGLAFEPKELRPIAASGSVYLPLIVGMWIVQNVDLYMLSHYAPSAEVGIYRLANRVASVASYFLSAFLLAWVPVSRTPLFDAVRRQRGVAGLGNLLVTYYCFASIGMVLALGVGAELLTRVAPPAYGKAAPLIPLIGLGFIAYGLYVVLYRGASFPLRRRKYFGLAWVAAAVLILSGLFLMPRYGSYGAAWAVIIAFAVAAGGMLLLSELGPNPLRVPWWRVFLAAATAAGIYLLSTLADGQQGRYQALVDLGALMLYPIAIAALGIVPRADVRPVLASLGALASGRRTKRQLAQQLTALSPQERAELRSAIAGRPGEGIERSVGMLRQLSGAELDAHELDREIGMFLLAKEALAERDARFRRLRTAGFDPLVLHQLEVTVIRLRELPGRAWTA